MGNPYLKMDGETAKKTYWVAMGVWAVCGLALGFLWDWRVGIGWFASGLVIPKVELTRRVVSV